MSSMHMIDESCKAYRPARHPRALYVSPKGFVKWTGLLAEPDAAGTDGPLPSVGDARDHLRRNPTPGPITVWIRGGTYELDAPLEFGPDDTTPVTYAAYGDEEVVFSGGRRITRWREVEPGGVRMWAADLAGEPDWHFRQLFVNGRRRYRPRLPKQGFYTMQRVPGVTLDGFMSGVVSDCFVAAPGDFDRWENLTDVEVVAFHFWNEERMPVVSYDPQTRMVRCSRKSVWPLKDDVTPRFARYFVENVKEALTQPGEWYLDRREHVVYYIPTEDETLDDAVIVAPRIAQLLIVRGDPATGRKAANLTFQGLHFRCTSWHQPGDRAGYEQAALNVPAVISLAHAAHCAIRGCSVSHAGFYAVELGSGCVANEVAGCTLSDLGAGGVKIVGVDAEADPKCRTHDNVVSDNTICDGGKVFASAVGVLVVHSAGNDIVHNHIHHLEYSGVSCGWTWGYGPSATHHNLIAHNHIHHLGTGLLNDMGGIYTLGVQPGTVIRNNVIHDIRMHNYGGWAIYTDEGSSYLLIENNLCYRTDSEVLQVHYGRENMVRNNIFAFSELGQVSLTVPEAGRSFTFIGNLVVTDGRPILVARDGRSLRQGGFFSDLNLFWDVAGGVFSGAQRRNERGQAVTVERWSFAEMQALGFDRHSVVADPKLWDLLGGRIGIEPDSPAFALGFVWPDLSDVGPRRPG